MPRTERAPGAARWAPGRHAALVLSVSAIAALVATVSVPPRPLLLWNASASMPIGLYRLAPPRDVARGDVLVARLTGDAARLAVSRRYLPAGVPVIKRAAALPGDPVCARGAAVITGQRVAARKSADGFGRAMPAWSGCRGLRAGEVFLLGDGADSFDSRYFGPVAMTAVMAKARPLWLR